MDSCKFPPLMIPPPSSSHKFAAYPPNALDQPQDPPELPKSVDKSEGLFSMYLDRSDEDDRKVTENWKGETDAMLIFVSPSFVITFAIEPLIFLNAHTIDWSFLSCSRRSSFSFNTRPSTKFAGHLSLLPRKYLPSPRQYNQPSAHHPFYPSRPT